AVGAGDLPRVADQGGVALVQRAHGHHDGTAAGTRACGQFGGGAQQGGGHPASPLVLSASTPSRSSASSGLSSPCASARSAVARAIARYPATVPGACRRSSLTCAA